MNSINTIIISNLKFYKSKSIEKMSVKNIMLEIEGLIKNTVMSCASLYGFSAEEALAKIDANGNLIKAVVDKAAEKAEKQRLKEAEKAEKQRLKVQKEAEKQEKEALAKQQKEAEKIQKEAEKQEKEAEKLRLKEALVVEKLRLKEALEAERSSMKEEEVLSKAAEKQALKASLKQQKEAEKALVKEKKPAKKVKKVAVIDEPVVISPSKEDDDCFILFQNIPLMNEINSIRDVKKFKNYKKLSAGVKLARQIMDI